MREDGRVEQRGHPSRRAPSRGFERRPNGRRGRRRGPRRRLVGDLTKARAKVGARRRRVGEGRGDRVQVVERAPVELAQRVDALADQLRDLGFTEALGGRLQGAQCAAKIALRSREAPPNPALVARRRRPAAGARPGSRARDGTARRPRSAARRPRPPRPRSLHRTARRSERRARARSCWRSSCRARH